MIERVGRPPGRFFRRKECWVPTWRTWAIALAVGLAGVAGVVFGIHPFLALTRPVTADVLVVEGWCDDEVMKAALAEFERNRYSSLLVTGGPVDMGAALNAYSTFAEFGAANLRKMAHPEVPIVPVPAPRVDRDRTYSTAVALRQWFLKQGSPPARINLVTVGPHARRSHLLFQIALGKETEVGILSIPDPKFDPDRWWTSSAGVRTVIGEFLAYAYAATLFQPSPLSAGAAKPPLPVDRPNGP